MPRSPLGGRLAAAVLAVAVLVVAWAGLYAGDGPGRLVALGAVAAVPAVAAGVSRWRAAVLAASLAAALIAVLAIATRQQPGGLVLLHDRAWSTVGGILPDGLRQGSHTGLPVRFAATPSLVALLDAALAALAGSAAWQIAVRGRPVAGIAIVAAGLAYRWTVAPPASSAGAAVPALGAMLAILALATWDPSRARRPLRRAGGALVLGAAAVAVAAGVGSGPAKAGEGWWAWRDWSLGGAGSTSASLDLEQRYGTLNWPATPRVALTVQAAAAESVRAVGLDGFDGVSFTLDDRSGTTPIPIEAGTIRPPRPAGAVSPPHRAMLVQRISLVGARTPLLLAAGRPVAISGAFSGTADMIGDAIRVRDPLGPGDSYVVTSVVPQPRPSDLIAAPPLAGSVAPARSTLLRAGQGEPAVETPLFGSGLQAPPDAALGPYAPVRSLARRVVGGASTEYAAVNRIEAYLRSRYAYDEAPPYPATRPDGSRPSFGQAPPPVVDFLLVGHRGFCQHFAAAMGVMLRSLGIPARVAVGFTGGSYDAATKRYVVLDRDAHSWVEVWFPGQGWLPFDPTPGRSAANPASVSSPDYAPSRIDVSVAGLIGSAVAPGAPGSSAPPPPSPRGRRAAPARAVAPVAGAGGGTGWRWALPGLLALAAVVPAARLVRRARARRHGDERTRVIAAVRELESALAALGWAPPATASPSERAAAVRAQTGVDASGLYARAARARYGPQPPRAGEAAAAWRELTAVLRAARRRAPLRARVRSAVAPAWRRRGTVGA